MAESKTKKKINEKNYQIDWLIDFNGVITHLSYLPTPPLGQDMTQGQFLSEV